MKPQLIIEICPLEPRASACLADGREVRDNPNLALDLAACRASGDVEEACAYIRDHVGVDFRVIARNADGKYENRAATAQEKADTCRAIYFESETDFDDESTAELYLIWQAADSAETYGEGD